MIDVYNGRNFSVLVKLIEIKSDMPDIIKFGIWKYKL